MKTNLERVKELVKKVNEGIATIDEQIEHYEMQISIANPNTEVGKRYIKKMTQRLEAVKELKAIEECKINNQEVITNIESIETVYLSNDNNNINWNNLYKARIKKGNIINVIFKDGEKWDNIKVNNITFGMKYINHSCTNYDKEYRMNIEYINVDNNKIYCINTNNVSYIEIVSRDSRSKKYLLQDNKSIQYIINRVNQIKKEI